MFKYSLSILITSVQGFLMGAADIVPGVSGGTVALVCGIYERLIENVRTGARVLGSFLKFDFKGVASNFMKIEWDFLIPLAAGIGAAVWSLASIIEQALDEHAEPMAGLFFGLVMASVVIAWSLMESPKTNEIIIMVAVGAVFFFLLGLNPGIYIDPPFWAFLGAGSVAICAMILPGISGSFILLLLGMYKAVLEALKESNFESLLFFFLGAIIGLAIFSSLLGKLLDDYYDMVLAVLIGLMLGSFRVLWPWPNGVGLIHDDKVESGTGLGLPDTPSEMFVPIVLAGLGFFLVLGINGLVKESR